MNTFRYHFVFQKKSTTEDSYFPVLGKVSYSDETIVKWEPACCEKGTFGQGARITIVEV